MQATKQLLQFIIDQKLELEDYHKLEPLLKEKFEIRREGKDATKDLIDFIIHWEKNTAIYDSLEKMINQNYWITQTELNLISKPAQSGKNEKG